MPDRIENLGFARIDHDREHRRGRAEVAFCAGKTPEETATISHAIFERAGRFLGTRATPDHYQAVRGVLPDAVYHERSRIITCGPPAETKLAGPVGVVCAGTSDLGVAGEASETLRFFGREVSTWNDVGVAGIHRLFQVLPELRECRVVIAVAGMEGALPSVVAGLLSCPVIAVPTSVGYGAAFQGVAAMLGMLTSCADGITVVNIDNGYGAACAADSILRTAEAIVDGTSPDMA